MKTEDDYKNWFKQLSFKDKEKAFNSYQIDKAFLERYQKEYVDKCLDKGNSLNVGNHEKNK